MTQISVNTVQNDEKWNQWFTGFTDGESCFNLDVHVKEDMRWGLQMQPEFTVVQHERDKPLLESFKAKFQCGSVGINRKDKTSTRYHYRVKSVKHLKENIIPFFDQNPLRTQKNVEFQRFKQICHLMSAGYHRESLKNFLEVYDLGQELRIRDTPKRGNKGEKVEKIINELRDRLNKNPDLK